MRQQVALHGKDNRIGGVDPIPPGRWQFEGTADSFLNGWANAGGGLQEFRWRRTNENQTEVQGFIQGGTAQPVINLSDPYRPAAVQYAVGSDSAGGLIVWVFEPSGDLSFFDAAAGVGPSSAGNGLAESGGVLSVNVDGATLEISADTLRVKDGGITTAKLSFDPATQTELDAHTTDATDAHDASAISIVDTGGYFTGIQVEAALQELAAADSSGFSLETPAGTIDGSNDTFTLSAAPVPSTDLLLFKNGLLMEQTVDYTLSTNTITFVAAQIPPTGSTLLASIPSAPGGGGGGAEVVAYNEQTSTTNVTATVEASADTVVTAPAFTADGSSTYLIEFWAPSCTPDSGAAGRNLNVVLFEDGSSIGFFGGIQTAAASHANQTMKSERYMIPAAGSRTYSVRAIVNAGTGTIAAGTGGAGNEMPAFICITRIG